MVSLEFKQILSIILVNFIALWLTYGFFVAANPLSIKEVPSKLNCKLSIDYPDKVWYGERFSVSGRLICEEEAPYQLMVRALFICGDLQTLTVNSTIIEEDGTFEVDLKPSFPKPSVNEVQCGLTVHVVSKTASTGLIERGTLTMIVRG